MKKMIFAVNQYGEFGLGEGMPWPKSKEDMKHFKEYTHNNIIIAGRKTAETFPSSLPYRCMLCLTSSTEPVKYKDGSSVAHQKNELPDLYDYTIIGGKSLIEKNIKDMDEVSITKFYLDHLECDVRLNLIHIENMLNKYFKKKESKSIQNGVITIWEKYQKNN